MKILELQQLTQERYAAERGMQNPATIETRGQFVDYVREMREYLNMEIDEVLAAVDFSGACRKPWKEKYIMLRDLELIHEDYEDKLKEEAVDALCFMMNICLACGVTQENIDKLYGEVYAKNMGRLDHDY